MLHNQKVCSFVDHKERMNKPDSNDTDTILGFNFFSEMKKKVSNELSKKNLHVNDSREPKFSQMSNKDDCILRHSSLGDFEDKFENIPIFSEKNTISIGNSASYFTSFADSEDDIMKKQEKKEDVAEDEEEADFIQMICDWEPTEKDRAKLAIDVEVERDGRRESDYSMRGQIAMAVKWRREDEEFLTKLTQMQMMEEEHMNDNEEIDEGCDTINDIDYHAQVTQDIQSSDSALLKQRIRLTRDQLKEAKKFFRLYGKWVDKFSFFSAEEKMLWEAERRRLVEKAEKKEEEWAHRKRKKATLEEMKEILRRLEGEGRREGGEEEEEAEDRTGEIERLQEKIKKKERKLVESEKRKEFSEKEKFNYYETIREEKKKKRLLKNLKQELKDKCFCPSSLSTPPPLPLPPNFFSTSFDSNEMMFESDLSSFIAPSSFPFVGTNINCFPQPLVESDECQTLPAIEGHQILDIPHSALQPSSDRLSAQNTYLSSPKEETVHSQFFEPTFSLQLLHSNDFSTNFWESEDISLFPADCSSAEISQPSQFQSYPDASFSSSASLQSECPSFNFYNSDPFQFDNAPLSCPPPGFPFASSFVPCSEQTDFNSCFSSIQNPCSSTDSSQLHQIETSSVHPPGHSSHHYDCSSSFNRSSNTFRKKKANPLTQPMTFSLSSLRGSSFNVTLAPVSSNKN
eukprot:MONOS_8160.1-p1 / transcript=MONOS_8160.1 / gene=MONOS_8160 / organism=Monocercomonoides_exilis_PA203 / gene_product=unspecified product / transcript_product=unspecified product / location=Mono_scaffold00299:35615-37669(+) / protein_length=685 / sequence_SO=supercontig / SO=protein_coding / is_pseudo=false